jgi:hypothetical protein
MLMKKYIHILGCDLVLWMVIQLTNFISQQIFDVRVERSTFRWYMQNLPLGQDSAQRKNFRDNHGKNIKNFGSFSL